ncbi:MAG: ABC transporter permease [Planctomycetota bacterium]|jgi:hypothetical protein
MLARISRKLDEAANPVMMKEVYQSVHSRRLMGAFWLLLGVAVLTYYLVNRHVAAPSRPGETMFVLFALLMGLMGIFMIPYSAFSGLYAEVTSGTLELVRITGMGSIRLVRGRLLAAAVKVLLLLSIIAPFAVTSFLFGGVDLVQILTVMHAMLLLSLCACAVGVFFAAMAAYPGMGVLARWLFLGLHVMGLLAFLGFCLGVLVDVGSSMLGARALAVELVGVTVLAALAIAFLNACSANALRPPRLRSSARAKLTALAIVCALLGWLIARTAARGHGYSLHVTVGAYALGFAFAASNVLAGLFLGVCCLMWMAADFPADRRPGEGRRARRWVGRLFCDGPGPTVAFACLALCLVPLVWVLCFLPGVPAGSWRHWESEAAICPPVLALTFVLYVSALARIVTNFLPRRNRTAMARRIASVLLLAGGFGVALCAVLAAGPYGIEDLDGFASAAVPPLYLVFCLEAEPEVGEFLAHMAAPFCLGAGFYLVRGVALGSRAVLREATPAGAKGA